MSLEQVRPASEETVRLLDAERRRIMKLKTKVSAESFVGFQALEECEAILADATDRVQEIDGVIDPEGDN